MTSLFEHALGEAWGALHPRLRDRYGLVTEEGRRAVGTGRMHELTRHPLAVPVLSLGTADDFLFPESGTDVPFTITTEPFVDAAGYEALYLQRHFETDPPREFVDTLRWNRDRGCITDCFGRRGHVVADLHLDVQDGALSLSLGTQWLRLRGRYLRLPGPLAVDATLRDRYDDEAEAFRVTAEIRNPLIGQVFGYRGRFHNEFRPGEPATPTTSRLDRIELPGAKK